jgi:DNA-binding transcriptional regulator YiaG
MNEELFARSGQALSASPLHYRDCGLDHIFVCNGYTIEHRDAEDFVEVEDREGLHQAIALHLVCNRKVLAGKEIRFIRNQMDLTQAQMAALLGTTSQSFARWEKEQTEFPGTADRLLRINFLVSMLSAEEFQQKVRELPNNLEEMDEVRDERVHFSHEVQWAAAA